MSYRTLKHRTLKLEKTDSDDSDAENVSDTDLSTNISTSTMDISSNISVSDVSMSRRDTDTDSVGHNNRTENR